MTSTPNITYWTRRNPDGTTYQVRRVDATEQAQLVRRALTQAFPGQHFSVRTKRYSGGCSIRVHWTDGPLQSDVQRVCNAYLGGSFDGMIDLATDSLLWLHPDGRTLVHRADIGHSHGERVVHADPPGPEWEIVEFSAHYVAAQRTISPALLNRARAIADHLAWRAHSDGSIYWAGEILRGDAQSLPWHIAYLTPCPHSTDAHA